MRGSRKQYIISTIKLTPTTKADDNKNIPNSKFKSRANNDSNASIHNPGHANTDSTITDPPIKAPT